MGNSHSILTRNQLKGKLVYKKFVSSTGLKFCVTEFLREVTDTTTRAFPSRDVTARRAFIEYCVAGCKFADVRAFLSCPL